MPERVPSVCVFHRSWPRPHKWSTSGISWDLQRPGRNGSISQERSGWWALGIVDYLMGSRSVLRWVLLVSWWMNLWTYRCLFRCIWGFLWSVSWAKNEACFQTKRSEILNLHCKRIWELSTPIFFSRFFLKHWGLLVRRFDFIALRVVISCEVWREGTHRGMEFAQIFYQRRTNAGSSDGS